MKNFFLLFLLSIAQLSGRAQEKDPSTLTKSGDIAPNFSFEIDSGKVVHLTDFKGKIVMINFFATWCGPCRLELPRVQNEIWNKYKNDSRFALFIFGREEGWNKVLAFKQTNKYDFLMLPDENRKIYSLYATQFIPRNYLIDENGKIIFQSMGYTPAEFDKLVSLIEKKIKSIKR